MKKVIVSIVISMLVMPPFAFAQQAMSSATYAIESDSLNSGGIRSTSGSYGIEDSAGEVSTGRSNSSNFGLFEAGYQGMRTDIAAPTNVAPTTPTNVSASVVSSSSIDLTWDASTDDFAVAGYYIYRNGVKIASVASFPREYLDTGLTANTQYTYNVSAFDEDDNESALSADAGATTSSAPASASASSGHALMMNFNITPDATSALVSFTTQSPVIASVAWGTDGTYTSGSVSDAAASYEHHLFIEGLAPGMRYFVKLSLADQNGELNFQNISFVTLKVSNTLPPPNVTHLVAKGSEKSIALTWTNPNDPKFAGVKIVRSEVFYPGEPTDGTVVFSGRTNHFTDTNVKAGKTYYYTVFTTDQAGNYSSGSVTSARLVAGGETPVSTPPLSQVPQASHVNPMVDALTLKDFLFIQNGDSVPVTNTLSLDGTKNTTVALKYYRVPEVLKTIAVTLSTTGENPEYFTFILKANRDKTRYEATIGPLGDPRDYNVRITVLDFENQSLKTIDGTVHVTPAAAPTFVPAPGTNPFAARTTSLALLVLLGVILAAFFFLRGRLLRPAVAAAGSLIFLLLIPSTFAHAAINPEINYQGRLVDGSNVAVTNGTYNMRFNLYTAASGGTSIWTETRTGADGVAVTSGLFSVMLGSVNSLAGVDFNQPLYLGVEIGGTAASPSWDGEMSPRKIIGAVPAAFVADTLDGIDSTQFVRTDANTTITADLTINGALDVTTGTGDWIGTFGGQSASYYLANAFSTTSANYWKSVNNFFSTTSANAYLATKTTDDLTEGSTNKYFTQASFDTALEATTTLNNLAVLKGVTDLIATRSTTTNATSTNLFTTHVVATNATTTNLFATTASTTNFFGAGLTTCNTSGSSALTWNAGVFGCNTITGGSSFGQAFEINAAGYLAPTTTITTLLNGGFVSQASSTVAGNLTATGLTSLSNLLLSGSTTLQNVTFVNGTGTAATTTSFSITSLASTLLKTNAQGSIIAAIAGTDYVANTNGDWTGTFDGQEGTYYLANSFSTTSANYWKSVNNFFSTTSADFWKSSNNFFSTTSADAYLATKTTDNLTEGSTNKYFTQTAFDTALEATTTLNNLAVLKGVTDLIATRSTTTNATTTNFFASVASSTDLFATNGTVGALTAASVSAGSFTGAGLVACSNANNALIWSGGLFGCSTITGSGGGGTDVNWSFFNNSGIRVATTSNQVLIGASSTSTLSKLEVVGGLSFDNATGTNATTTSLAISSLVSKLLKTNANGSVIAAVANTDYQSPVTLTTTGTSGVATFDGTTLNIPNYGAGSYSSTTLLGDNSTFSGNNTFNNTITGSISGNAGTATALQNARTINGVSFNGTADITITAASSTLLANNNTFTGNNIFANTTTTNSFTTTASSTNLFTTNGTIGTLTAGVLTSGLINGQTISSAANFTGTLNVTSGLTTLANLLVSGSSTLQNFTFVNATGTSATTTNFFASSAIRTNGTLTALGNVGIGTSTPPSRLTIATSTTYTAAFPDLLIGPRGLVSGSANGTLIGANTNAGFGGNFIDFQVNGTSQFSIEKDGAVDANKFAFFNGNNFQTSGSLIYTNASFETTGLKFWDGATGNGQITPNADGILEISNAAGNGFTRLQLGGVDSAFPALARNGQGVIVQLADGTNGGYFGVGTSTPKWTAEFASSTRPQLALSDGSLTSNHWTLRNAGGVLYFATASPSTFATSSSAALTIDANGLLTFQALNTTTTNATTTNFFTTTASSTNLFTTNGTIGTLTAGVLTSGLINGQTISSAANFTGTLNVTSGLTTLANLLVSGSSTLQNFTALNSTSTNATTTTLFASNAIRTNGVLSALGNVGVGIADPVSPAGIARILEVYSDTGAAGVVLKSVDGFTWEGFAENNGDLSFTNNGSPTYSLQLYNDGSAGIGSTFTHSNQMLNLKALSGYSGFGTSSPNWLLQLATSTRPQLALSDGSLTSNHWTLRNAGGNLYFATASPTTFGTSTKSALTIDANGQITAPFYGSGCAQFSSGGTLTSTGTNCGSGAGGTNTDKFATSSNGLAIYPNAATALVIGGSATTTTGAALEVLGQFYVSSSSTLQNFSGVNGTTSNFFATTASSSKLFAAQAKIGTNALVVNTAGNVAIGQANPSYKLDVNGDINFGASSAIYTGGVAVLSAPSTNSSTMLGLLAGSNVTSDGFFNTLLGYQAGSINGAADHNTAVGYSALANSTGSNNTAVGSQAGNSNTTGASNSFFGFNAGELNTTGSQNVLVGYQAGFNNGSATSTVAVGYGAGAGATNYNAQNYTALGYQALANIITGANDNTALGYQAGLNVSSGSKNILLGYQAGSNLTTGSSNIVIGYNINTLTAGVSNRLNIGNAIFGSGINGTGNTLSTATIGIGTTTPQFLLQLASSSAPQLALSDGSLTSNHWTLRNAGGNLYFATASPSTFGTSTASALSIDANGLITTSGTINSQTISSAANFTGTLSVATSMTAPILLGGTSAGSTLTLQSTSGSGTLNVAGIQFKVGNNGGTTALAVLNNGNIGIGTTTPNWTLQVASATPYLTLTDTDAAVNRKHVLLSSNDGIFKIGTSSDALDATSTAFSLDPGAAAQFGLGTSTPWKTLAVTGTVGLDGLTGSTGAGSLCLSSNKEVVYNSGSDSCLSSLRSTKHDITPLTMDALDMLGKLESVSFVYNTGATTTRYGFIADDASAIDTHFGTYDADGHLSGIDDRALLSVAIKGIQELNQKFASSTSADTSGFASGLDAVKSAIGLNLDDVSAGLDIGSNVTIRGGLKVDHLASISDLLMLESDVEFVGRPYFNSDTGGLAVVEAGKSQVDVVFDRPYIDAPVVSTTISLDASTTDSDLGIVLASNPTYVVGHRSANGFSIILSKPAERNTTFSWIALAIKDMKIANSASTTQPIWSFSNDTTVGTSTTPVTPTPSPVPPVDASSTPPTDAASSTPPTDTASSTPVIVDTTDTSASSTPAVTDTNAPATPVASADSTASSTTTTS